MDEHAKQPRSAQCRTARKTGEYIFALTFVGVNGIAGTKPPEHPRLHTHLSLARPPVPCSPAGVPRPRSHLHRPVHVCAASPTHRQPGAALTSHGIDHFPRNRLQHLPRQLADQALRGSCRSGRTMGRTRGHHQRARGRELALSRLQRVSEQPCVGAPTHPAALLLARPLASAQEAELRAACARHVGAALVPLHEAKARGAHLRGARGGPRCEACIFADEGCEPLQPVRVV
mmetsp:Transcript_38536/g.106386  ORF Transcript_38536/g.106386 Transcript_38536/m.106386 type:complete len:231 (-) Transcript_38536:378-1070(-)